ncbi:MAG TPA: sortase [bacterium]|nr:sortase [bacterium]
MQKQLSEEELLRIFSDKRPIDSITTAFFGILGKILLFLFLVVVSYFVINVNAIKQKFDYWYQNDFLAKPYNTAVNLTNEETSLPKPEEKPVDPMPDLPENNLRIPALNITAPTSWRVNNIPAEVSKSLENGLIQINGTSMPGEKGNMYITGHSSNFVWAKGNYNSIFATLDNLVAGDSVYLRFDKKVYIYKVTEKKIVVPTDLSVMAGTNDTRLTLVTCWPVGTTLKRLVVVANQTDPDPKNNKEPEQQIKLDSLVGGR